MDAIVRNTATHCAPSGASPWSSFFESFWLPSGAVDTKGDRIDSLAERAHQ